MTTLSLLLATTVLVSPGDVLQAAIARAHGGKVILRPGTYLVERTLEIGGADDGLTVVAQKPGTVRLLGGRVLRNWTAAEDARLDPSARTHVRACDLSAQGITDLGSMARTGFSVGRERSGLELFFDARPMTLARYPNAGWLRTGPGTQRQRIAFPNDRIARWSAKGDVWAMGYWKFDWAETYERVTDADAKSFGLADAPPFGTDAGRRFFFLNALEELDAPGEWYLDRPARRLYFWPPEEKGEAVASVLNGPMFHLKNASRVTLRCLSLEAGRGGGVLVEGGERNVVQECLIRNFGTFGVALMGGRDSGVVGCDLTGLGNRGITLSGGDRKTLTPARLYAEDDHVWAYSRLERTYQPAVGVDGVGNRVSRCLFEDAPHNAVLLSGNDHLLEGNDVRRVCQETGDSGAFYMGRNPTMRGTIVRGNRFRDLGAKVSTESSFTEVMSVYLDDGFPGTTISGNLFEGPGTGIMLGGGQDNAVVGNVFVGKRPAVHLDARGRGWAKDMIVNPEGWDFEGKVREVDATGGVYTARYPRLRDVLVRGFRDPSGTRIVDNVAVGGDWLRLQDGLTEKDFENRSNVVLPQGTLADALRVRPFDAAKVGLRTKRRPIDLATPMKAIAH